MRRWFLSYHSPDQALAERLKAALERRDTDARVFFAPSSLRAGGFWSRALAEEIALRYLHAPELQEQTRALTMRRMELLYDVWSVDY